MFVDNPSMIGMVGKNGTELLMTSRVLQVMTLQTRRCKKQQTVRDKQALKERSFLLLQITYHGIGKKDNDMLPNNLSFAFTTLAGSSSLALFSPPKKDESESESEESEE